MHPWLVLACGQEVRSTRNIVVNKSFGVQSASMNSSTEWLPAFQAEFGASCWPVMKLKIPGQ